jgi:integrase
MQDLCAAADIDIDGDYLKLHGARRGLGSDLYEADAELAQEVLRHQSVETTQESYRDVDMAQRREDVGEALGRRAQAESDNRAVE